MPSFNGRFQYSSPSHAEQAGACRLSLDGPNLQLIPDSGSPIAIDLGDIDAYVPGDYQLSLRIYDGSLIVLSHFAKTFQNLAHDLLEAYRDRMVQCLLLEDLEEVVRAEGFAQLESDDRKLSSRSELRLYGSNVAVLPEGATAMQWRLADIDSVEFDEMDHALKLRSGADRLVLGRLAKRTGEFRMRLQASMQDVSEKGARILHKLLPFLTPDQFQKTAAVLKDGRAASLAGLDLIHPKISQALLNQTVDSKLLPYFDALQRCAVEKSQFAGFKLIRKEKEDEFAEEAEPGADPLEVLELEGQSVFFWYFFPLRNAQGRHLNLVAWEAVSVGGRATYFFRLVPPEQENALQDASRCRAVVDESVRKLNQALVLLNFRREPIYLPDASLETQPRYRRYAIACRKMPVLRQLRSLFVGRALHASVEEWEQQVMQITGKAGL